MERCIVRYPQDANPCNGKMAPHRGAFKCEKCGCVDAPLDEPMVSLAAGKVQLRVVHGFAPGEIAKLAYWWRRQWDGYGEYDTDERY